MSKKRLCNAVVLALAAALLVGCGMRASPGRDDRAGRDHRAPTSDTLTPPALATLISTVVVLQTETPTEPTAADPCGPRIEITKVVGSLVSQPDNILLQLAWEGGFTRPEFALGGRVPEFTLLTDGRAFYQVPDDPLLFDRGEVMVVHLTPAERQELVQRVLDLGFERLESYPDSCRPLPGGMCECVEDAGTSIIRLQLASGEIREVRNYFTFANDPDALAAIRALLEGYRHPQAERYIPEKTALSIQAVEATAAVSPSDNLAVQDWPLSSSWLAGASAVPCYRVLSGSDDKALLSATGRNIGDFYFRRAGTNAVYRIFLTPWLPGVDYTDRIASSGQACPSMEALPPPLPAPTAFPGMPQPGATTTRQMTKDGMVMRYVPAGPFTMGSPEGVGRRNEQPRHVVNLGAFWIDETEVTQAHYEMCVAAGACDVQGIRSYDPGSSKPVEAPWDVAQAYCRWVGGRLPAEAEWEKAARGSDGRAYPWGERQPDCTLANHASRTGFCSDGPLDAGSYPDGASPYWVLDMAGNVAEWVGDWYDPGYYAISPEQDPQGPASGQERVVRGGAGDDTFFAIRAAYRDARDPDDVGIGFRCVVPAAVYTVVESNRYDGWYRYTNPDYGFSFHYPPDWTLEDKLHLLVFNHKVADTLRFTVAYHGIDEDIWLFRTCMPAGDFVPQGSVLFLGRELLRNVLVYEGKDKLVSYSYGDATPWTDVVLNIVLEEWVTPYEAIDLPEDVQKQVDQVVSSFERTGD